MGADTEGQEASETVMYRSPAYLAYIRSKPCVVCGNPETIAHHEPMKQGGRGIKAPDTYCIPLCVRCHNDRHTIGSAFLNSYDLKIIIIKQLTGYLELLEGKYTKGDSV